MTEAVGNLFAAVKGEILDLPIKELCVVRKKGRKRRVVCLKVLGCFCLEEEEKKNQHNEPKLPLCLTLYVSLSASLLSLHPLSLFSSHPTDSCFCAAKLTAPLLLLEKGK